jgi:hypothetical protein
VNYLALDQSPLRVGFAHAGPDSEMPKWGVYHLSRRSMEGSLRDWLQTMVTLLPIRRVIYEQPFLGARSHAQRLMSICALPPIIRLVCEDCDVPCEAAPIDQWRRHFIGFAKAPKELKHKGRRRRWLKDAAMRACVERDWFVTKDDEADALGILDWALCRDFPKRGSDTAALFRELRGAA